MFSEDFEKPGIHGTVHGIFTDMQEVEFLWDQCRKIYREPSHGSYASGNPVQLLLDVWKLQKFKDAKC